MQQNFKNILAIHHLLALGFPLPNVRKAMHKLTGVGQPDMAKELGVSRQNITLHIDGLRSKRSIQEGIADIWQVPVEMLFDGTQKDNPRTRSDLRA